MKEVSLVIIGLGLGFIVTRQVMNIRHCKKVEEAGDKAWNEAMDTAHDNFKKLLRYCAQTNVHPSAILKHIEQQKPA